MHGAENPPLLSLHVLFAANAKDSPLTCTLNTKFVPSLADSCFHQQWCLEDHSSCKAETLDEREDERLARHMCLVLACTSIWSTCFHGKDNPSNFSLKPEAHQLHVHQHHCQVSRFLPPQMQSKQNQVSLPWVDHGQIFIGPSMIFALQHWCWEC